MSGKRSQVGIVIRALLEKYPDSPAKTLARMAYRENPRLWRDLESCRCSVRYYLGNQGEKNRRKGDKKHHRKPRKSGWSDVIPEALIQLPDWKAETIAGPHRVLVLSDIHIPFHDAKALEIALDHGRTLRPTMVLLNGDIADHYAMSDYVKDPTHRDFPAEIMAVRKFLAGMRERFGRSCRIIYKHGNHEERYERYMRYKAPELIGTDEFQWDSVFGLRSYNVQMVSHKRPIRLGKLNVIHGHEYNFAISNPVNPARGLFLRAKTHAICGHFHQTSSHSEKNLEQKVVSTWSTGALCDLHPEYRPLNSWNHGFAWVEIGKDGEFHVENHKVIGGKVW